jgi:hypothetical protein
MTDKPKTGVWEPVKQGLLWIAKKMAEAIRWVARKLEGVADSVEKGTEATAEVVEQVFQRASENPAVKAVVNMFRIAEVVKDAKNILGTICGTFMWLWAVAMGQACSSGAALPWAASSGWCALGAMYFGMLAATGILFALFLIDLLGTVSRR